MSNRSSEPAAAAYLPLQPRDYLILFALADGKLHGHGMLKAIESASGGVLIDPANLYRSLRRLDRDGLVSEQKASAKDARSRRRQFALTSLGRAVLEAEAGRLVRLADEARSRRLIPGIRGER